MNKLLHLTSLSILALSAVFGSSACTVASSDEQDLPAEAVAEGDENIGEAQDALVYTCASVGNTYWLDASEAFESTVRTEINKLRASGTTCNGVFKSKVPALTLNTALQCAARVHSKDMGEKNLFSHTGSDGTQPWNRYTQAGYTWSAAAENITPSSTALAAVTSWKNSTSGHCEAMMSASYTNFGAGYYYKSTASSGGHRTTLTLAKP